MESMEFEERCQIFYQQWNYTKIVTKSWITEEFNEILENIATASYKFAIQLFKKKLSRFHSLGVTGAVIIVGYTCAKMWEIPYTERINCKLSKTKNFYFYTMNCEKSVNSISRTGPSSARFALKRYSFEAKLNKNVIRNTFRNYLMGEHNHISTLTGCIKI